MLSNIHTYMTMYLFRLSAYLMVFSQRDVLLLCKKQKHFFYTLLEISMLYHQNLSRPTNQYVLLHLITIVKRCLLYLHKYFLCKGLSYVSTTKNLITLKIQMCGPGSVVGIATAYGLDGPRIESRWGEIFRASPDRP